MNEYNANAEELTNRITTLESENEELQLECKRLREDNQAIAIVGQASGENITLNDSSDARFKKFEICGNSSQETRKGYNLAKYTKGEYTSNTLSSLESFNLNLDKNINVSNGDELFFSADIKIVSGTACNMNTLRASSGSQKGEDVTNPTLTSTYQRYIFKNTFSFDGEISAFAFQVANNADSTVIQVDNLMISKENKEYEPYGASPSLEFPSEVKTVGQNGSVEINVCNKNFAYMNDGEYSYENNSFKIDNETLTINTNGSTGNYSFIDLVSGKTQQWAYTVEQLNSITDYKLTPKGGKIFWKVFIKQVPVSSVILYIFTNKKILDLNLKGNENENTIWSTDIEGVSTTSQYLPNACWIRIIKDKLEEVSVDGFKNFLKKLHEAGTPVAVYYKLSEQNLIPCNEEQSKILDEILKKLIAKKYYKEKTEIENKLNVFYAMSKITDEEYSTLTLQVEETYLEESTANTEIIENTEATEVAE